MVAGPIYAAQCSPRSARLGRHLDGFLTFFGRSWPVPTRVPRAQRARGHELHGRPPPGGGLIAYCQGSRLFPRHISLEHGETFRSSGVLHRFIAQAAQSLRQHEEDTIGGAEARDRLDVALEPAGHDQHFSCPCLDRRTGRGLCTPPPRLSLRRLCLIWSPRLHGPGLSMSLSGQMDLPAVDGTENQSRALPVAGRHTAHPMNRPERDVFLAGATAPPTFRHLRSSALAYRLTRTVR